MASEIKLPGYSILESVYSSQVTRIVRAERLSDSLPVLIKLLSPRYPKTEDIARLQREYETGSFLSGRGTVRYIAIESAGNGPALVMEDSAGIPLHKRLKQGRLSLHERIEIASQSADSLVHIHSAGVIHKDIKPQNIILVPKEKKALYIDFGIATTLKKQRSVHGVSLLEGTLLYISPEQTGRMNRPVDQRSDLYSFGTVLYEIFSGKPPFYSNDRMELIHSHIALEPQPLHSTPEGERIPDTIKEIIFKLLQKNPEERYNGIPGLARDLKLCLEHWRSGGSVQYFKPGAQDFSTEFRLPDKLYGRDKEVRELTQLFEQSLSGKPVALRVHGKSGTGKTALVHEYKRISANKNGRFLEGKFDQFKQDIPAAPFISAIRELVRDLSVLSEEKLESVKYRILDRLNGNGKVLTDQIPELKALIGDQPDLEALPVEQQKDRYLQAYEDFLSAVCTQENPVVLFLDDLQWADATSLDLFERLVVSEQSGNLLIAIAYRENEIQPGHPLELTLESIRRQLQEQGRPEISSIVVRPLGLNDIRKMLIDITESGPDESLISLASLIMERTSGVPFQVDQYLKSVAEKGLIQRNKEGGWEYDIRSIRRDGPGKDIIAEITRSVDLLASDEADLVRLAACAGSVFDLKILSFASGLEPETAVKKLKTAIDHEILYPIDEEYQFATQQSAREMAEKVRFQFFHDQTQQAVVSQLSADDKYRNHLAIARAYRQFYSFEQISEILPQVVSQFNAGRDLITDPDEVLYVVRLNLEQAEKARLANAYESAAFNAGTALDLLKKLKGDAHLSEPGQKARFELGMSHYLTGDAQKATRYFDELEKIAPETYRLEIYSFRTGMLTGSGHFPEAMTLAREALKGSSFEVKKQSRKKSLQRLEKLRDHFSRLNPDDFLKKSRSGDEVRSTEIEILAQLAAPAMLTNEEQALSITLVMAEHMVSEGQTNRSPLTLVLLACMAAMYLKDYEFAEKYGRIAIDLAEKKRANSLKPRVYFLYATIIMPFHYQENQLREMLRQALNFARQSGDKIFHAHCCLRLISVSLYSGMVRLVQLEKSIQTYKPVIERSGQKTVIELLKLFDQSAYSFRGGSRQKTKLQTERFDEKSVLSRWESADENLAFRFHMLCKYLLGCHFFDDAILTGKLMTDVSTFESILLKYHYLLYQLFLLKPEDTKKASVKKLLKESAQLSDELNSLKSRSPAFFAFRYSLLMAETERLNGNTASAMDYYDRAVSESREHNNHREAGLSAERAAKFYISLSRSAFAAMYLRRARRSYDSYQAPAKTEFLDRIGAKIHSIELEEALPDSAETERFQSSRSGQPAQDTDISISATLSSSDLDLASVMKASAIISGEMDFSSLIDKLFQIVIENSGAQRAVLILKQDDDWTVQADGKHPDPPVKMEVPLEEYGPVARTIVQYVQRTMQPVTSDQAVTDKLFHKDPYIVENRVVSVLCVPVLRQSQLTGILYLENNAVIGAFTGERVQLLSVLATQIATALDNAKLYGRVQSALEQETAARKDQQNLNEAISRFVPSPFLRLLNVENLTGVKLGDNIEKKMTVLFSDIRSFTSLSESMTPENNFRFINSYLNVIGPVVRENNGFIDKYIGDAIMALFEEEKDALLAVMGMFRVLKEYNQGRLQAGYDPVAIGTGIHSGILRLGTIGETDRMEGTVIGDTVNLASRVESLTKMYGADVLTTDTTADAAGLNMIQSRRVDKVRVKGKNEPVTLVEIFTDGDNPEVQAKINAKDSYEKGLTLYSQEDLTGARQAFQAALEAAPDDLAAKLMIERIQTFLAKPGRPFDPVFTLQSK